MHVILDLDGILADCTHRKPFLDKGNWEAYIESSAVMKDSPIPAAKRVLSRFQELKYDIQFISGRFEAQRDSTTRWLLEHFGFEATDFNLTMRAQANMLTAADAKIQAMQRQVAEYKVSRDSSIIFIDSDPAVFAAYASEGVLLKAPECWDLLFPEVADNE